MAEHTTNLKPILAPGRVAEPRLGRYLRPKRGSVSLLWVLSGLAAAVVLLPVVYLLVRALEADGRAWAGLLTAGTALTLLRTIGLALAVTAASAAISLPLAWLTTRTDLPGKRLWAVLAALPVAVPSYVGAYLFVAFFGPRGMLAQQLDAWFGIDRLPSLYGFPGALIVLTLLSYPYIFLNLRAALQGLDPALEEAARSLGKKPWATFWRVTFPQLRPALVAGSLLVTLYVFRDFGAVSLLRYDTFTRIIYVQYRSSFDRSAAAVLALALVGLTLAILWLEARARGKERYYGSAAGGKRPAAPHRLGTWRYPALGLVGAVVGGSLLLPAGVLGYWLLRGLQAGETLQALPGLVRDSLLSSGLAGGLAVAAAIPITFLSVRGQGRWKELPERLTYTGYALPGIAVALALVFLGANYLRPLYQTLPLLLLAYLALFLPQAVGALRGALLQVNPSLEEAARSLGKGPAETMARVTLPLVRPGLASGFMLVFLTTMKELPATLILSPLGFQTLAMAVWSSVSEAFFAQAAAPALLIIGLSSLPMAIILWKEQK